MTDNTSKEKGGVILKATAGRIRSLTAMAKPHAFARPDRSISGEPRTYRITSDMQGMFLRGGYMVETNAPKGVLLGYVWRITEKGRKWLETANIELTGGLGGSGNEHHQT